MLQRVAGRDRPEDGSRRAVAGGRERWLGHPAFLACVAVLVVNDHVLKDRHPGWWTGKLSDVVGLAVVGVVLAVVVGPRRGVPVAGAAFAALKLVPGVAELAAPVLGGVTLRDPTDLVALAVLVPLWRMLRAGGGATHDPPPADGAGAAPRPWARVRAGVAAVVPVVGLAFATVATTATSCGPDSAVVAVTADGGDLYALVGTGTTTSDDWARSADGGRTWRRTDPPADLATPSMTVPLYEDPGPVGPQKACASDGTCWRLRDRRAIERVVPDGTTVEEHRLSEDAFADIDTGCAGGSVGVLASIAAADVDGEARPVASLGADGVLVRQDDGSWDQVRVLSAPPEKAGTVESAATVAVFLVLVGFGPVLILVLWLAGRARWPSWRNGQAAAAVGWTVAMTVGGLGLVFADGDRDTTRIVALATVPTIVVVTSGAIAVARRPARVRPASRRPPTMLPPPPPGGYGVGERPGQPSDGGPIR